MDLEEGGPVDRVPAPALPHKLVHLRRTTWGTLHPIAGLQKLVNVGQLNTGIRRHAVGGDFPKEDPESPDVGLGRELVVCEAFRSRPLDGELGTRMSCVSVVTDETCEAEICDFDDVILAD